MSEESVKELEKAAADGNEDAQYELGVRCIKGDGVDVDLPKARRLLRPLADAGNVQAAIAFADACILQKTREDDTYDPARIEKAKEIVPYIESYLMKAITEGSDEAMLKLAGFYYGEGGELYREAALLYLESGKRKGDDDECPVETEHLGRMLEHGWLDDRWKFFRDILEFLSEHGNRDARHMLRRDEDIPEPSDDLDFDAFMSRTFELREEDAPVEKQRHTFGRQLGKRELPQIMLGMGIQFTYYANGIIKTKQGKEIEDLIQKLIDRGYKFKYSDRTDKWTVMYKKKTE